ncbi:MAG: DUF485 domain-containing protein [Gemmatimonadota bacterium]
MADPTVGRDERLRALARRRGWIAGILTGAMIVVYFGFIALIAFNPTLLGRRIGSGLSLGILLGAMVIVASWLLTWFYVRWANKHYDAELKSISEAKS